MNPINKYPPGTFNWADLATSDASGAKAFYSSLFDWTAEDIPVGSGIFTMLYGSGKEVASLYQLSHQQRAQGIPSHWMAYVAVANADDTTILARQLGGQVLVAPFDVLDLGRMALLLDPTGMPLALWQAGRHEGSQLVGQPSMMAWNNLMTPDPMRAAAFYTRLFGWQVGTVGNGSWIFSRNGRLQAGMKRPSSGPGLTMPG
jgi:predicted enzyme related to lactoylglutathione lyase